MEIDHIADVSKMVEIILIPLSRPFSGEAWERKKMTNKEINEFMTTSQMNELMKTIEFKDFTDKLYEKWHELYSKVDIDVKFNEEDFKDNVQQDVR